jgi:DUF1707 SHOCT-like domain
MGLRASDEDRERTVDFLRAQQALGRLTLDELEERSAAAWGAVEVADLERLTADLPRQPAPAPAPVAPRRGPRAPGRLGFSAPWRAPGDQASAMTELLEHVAPPMHAYGYELVERTPARLVFDRSRTPAWVVFPCVLLFPFGLLTLLIRTHERITVELIEREGETVFLASGVAPLSVRKAFAELED